MPGPEETRYGRSASAIHGRDRDAAQHNQLGAIPVILVGVGHSRRRAGGDERPASSLSITFSQSLGSGSETVES